MRTTIYVNAKPVDLRQLARIEPTSIRYLNADGCTGLTVLPALPACETLYAGGCTGLAVIDAGQDSREYHFHGVPLRIGWRICAGCRIKTVAEARAHWGPGGPSDRSDCRALVEKIAAEIERRENAR